jgi:cyclic pyranopterin phosphate synthase
MLAGEGIPDLALTTNGQRLAEMAAQLKDAGLRRVNVSLDSLRAEVFRTITRGGELRRTLKGIDAALSCGLEPVKINAVVLRPHNFDEVSDIARLALEKGCQVRFLELMPIGCARNIFEEAFVSADEVRARMEESFTLKALPVADGGTSRDFLAHDCHGRRGIIGFISPESRPFCTGCRRLRLTSTGRLIGCLASGNGPSVRELLRSNKPDAGERLIELVDAALRCKAEHSGFKCTPPMVAVGG